MSKFRPEKQKYFQTGVTGYIGSGNNLQVFTRRGKPSFSKLKQIYGSHLEDFKANNPRHKKEKKLSNELRTQIKENARKEYRSFIRKQILIICISIIITSGIIIAIGKIIFHFYPNLK